MPTKTTWFEEKMYELYCKSKYDPIIEKTGKRKRKKRKRILNES